MRILHLCARYWPGLGGIERYAREISERLTADGHTVTVATTDADEAESFWDPRRRRLSEREIELGGVRIRRYPLRYLPLAPRSYSVLRYLVFPVLAAAPFVPERWLRALARLTPWAPDLWRWAATTPERYDLIGALGILYEPFLAAGLHLARRLGAPCVAFPFTHLGAGPAPARDSVSRYYTMRHQVGLVRAAEAVVAMTPTEAAFYERQGVPADRLRIAPPGIEPEAVTGGDADRFRARHGLRGPVVAFLSAMARDKGAMHVVEAVRRLWAAGRAVELVLAGPVLAEFERYRATLPAAARDRLRVLGPVSEAEKRDLWAAADVVAMPSRTDSYGIVFLEAWANGKPVIGSRAWGMSDVIREGEDGLLVPYGDVGALTAALAGLLDDPERRAALGARGAAKVLASGAWAQRYPAVRDLYLALAGRSA